MKKFLFNIISVSIVLLSIFIFIVCHGDSTIDNDNDYDFDDAAILASFNIPPKAPVTLESEKYIKFYQQLKK